MTIEPNVAAIWAEIVAGSPKPAPTVDRAAGEKTARDLAADLDTTTKRAIGWAENLVADGKLEQVKRYDPESHRAVNAWRPVAGEEQ